MEDMREINDYSICRQNNDLYVKFEVYYGKMKLDEAKLKPFKYNKKFDYVLISDV